MSVWQLLSLIASMTATALAIVSMMYLKKSNRRAKNDLAMLDDRNEAIQTLMEVERCAQANDLIGALAALGMTDSLFDDVPMSESDGIMAVRVHDLKVRAGLIKGETE